eukprot:1576302-Rhodomonas_salina.3
MSASSSGVLDFACCIVLSASAQLALNSILMTHDNTKLVTRRQRGLPRHGVQVDRDKPVTLLQVGHHVTWDDVRVPSSAPSTGIVSVF